MCPRESRRYIVNALLLMLLLCRPPQLFSQSPAERSPRPSVRVLQELESIVAEAAAVTDKSAAVRIRARAAYLLWPADTERARKAFGDLWDWIEAQEAKNFDREAAFTEVIENVMPRSPELATKLLKRLAEKPKNETSSATERVVATGEVSPNVKRLNQLAAGLMLKDPARAAGLLEQSLAENLLPTTLGMLSELRKSNQTLADGLVSRVLTTLGARPTRQSLPAASSLIDYMFPAPRPAARTKVPPPSDALRQQFFFTTYGVLRQALAESEQQASPEVVAESETTVGYKTFCEAQLARALLALAGRYAPDRTAELSMLAERLSAGVPRQLSELSQYISDRINRVSYKPPAETPAAGVSLALKSGNFAEARRLAEGLDEEEARKFFGYQIAVAEFNYDLSKSDLTAALVVAKQVAHKPSAARMLAQVVGIAHRKGDAVFARQALAEGRSVIANGECDEEKASALLSLAGSIAPAFADDAVELLKLGIDCVNDLRKPSADAVDSKGGDVRRAAFDDPSTLQQAIAAVARIAPDSALLSAAAVEDKPLQLLARLSACEALLAGAARRKQ